MRIAVVDEQLGQAFRETLWAASDSLERGDSLLLCGINLSSSDLKSAAYSGVDEILPLCVPMDYESICHALYRVCLVHGLDLLLFPDSRLHRLIAVTLAQRRGGDCTLDCSKLSRRNGRLQVVKPVYSSNAYASFSINADFCTVVLRRRSYPELPAVTDATPILKSVIHSGTPARVILERLTPGQEDGLEDAKVVVVAGGGVRTQEELALVRCFADKIGAKLGGTRPLVMGGLLPISQLIGQSGKIIAPQLCITVAVSGATPFLAGVLGGEILIAVNRDENAPVFSYADYGIIKDYRELLPKL